MRPRRRPRPRAHDDFADDRHRVHEVPLGAAGRDRPREPRSRAVRDRGRPTTPTEPITLEPGRADVEVVVGGAAPVRILGRDDFGVRALVLEVSNAATETTVARWISPSRAWCSRTTQRGSRRSGLDRVPRRAGSSRTRLASLRHPRHRDLPRAHRAPDRQPRADANVTETAPIRLRVVSADEFLRASGMASAAPPPRSPR